MQVILRAVAVGAALACLASCKNSAPKADTRPSASSAPSEAPSAAPSAGQARRTASAVPTAIRVPSQTHFQIPVGPMLGVLPGRGLGPIRFGATLETIERHMEAPCTEKSETLCRYKAHALDFHLKDGVLERVVVHGDERPFNTLTSDTYGIFNGLLHGGARLGMYRHVVHQEFGAPIRTEEVSAGTSNTVRRDFYDGVVLEYDRLANGNVVLAGIEIVASKTARDDYRPKP